MQDPIEAGFRADIQPLIRQGRHDLSRRQRGVRRLVAGEQDPLALLLTQPVNDMARTAFTAILAVPITHKGTPPALEGAQADAKGPPQQAMLIENAWAPTTEASRLLGRSPSYLKRQRETHGGFLEAGRHYAMAPSANAPITWNVSLIREELHRRALLMRR